MNTHFAIVLVLCGMMIPFAHSAGGETSERIRIILSVPFQSGSSPHPLLLQRVDSLDHRIFTDLQLAKTLAATKGSGRYEYVFPSVRPGKYVVRLAPTYLSMRVPFYEIIEVRPSFTEFEIALPKPSPINFNLSTDDDALLKEDLNYVCIRRMDGDKLDPYFVQEQKLNWQGRSSRAKFIFLTKGNYRLYAINSELSTPVAQADVAITEADLLLQEGEVKQIDVLLKRPVGEKVVDCCQTDIERQ